MSDIDIDASDLFQELEELRKKAESLDGDQNVPLGELLSPDFMERHTQFESIEALLDAGNYSVVSTEDFEAIPDDEWDRHVATKTQFDDWNDMLETAIAEWTRKKLEL